MDKSLTDSYSACYEMASAIEQEDEEEAIFFVDIIENREKKKVLDIGCAEGKLATLLAKNGHDVTAVDISQGHVESVRKRSQGLALKAFCCDIEEDNGPLDGETFDVIFFMDVIEHLRNPTKALSNIRNLMDENSILIINTPNVVTPSRLTEYLIHPRKLINYYEPRNLNDLHLQTYDYFTMEKTLNFVGLKVQRVIPNLMTFPYMRWKIAKKAGKALSKGFPYFSDYVLVECIKTDPIDVEKQLEYWKSRNIKAH